MTRVPLWHYGEGIPPGFSVISWNLFKIFFTEEGSYQWLKDATSFGLLSDKTAEKLEGEYSNICQFSILAAWQTQSFVFICKLAE